MSESGPKGEKLKNEQGRMDIKEEFASKIVGREFAKVYLVEAAREREGESARQKES